MNAEILVSVRVPAYNHEKYIAQCLEGILMQRTDFAFEVIVGEDCSTDRTRQVVLDYANRRPDVIRVITSEKNVGPFENITRISRDCRGKYRALCEGDDYWIDPLKLQKQVSFMETHPDCPMCFHDALVVHEGKTGLPMYFCPDDLPEMITVGDILSRAWFVPTASTLIRARVLENLPAWRKNVANGDLLIQLWCAHHGSLKYLDEIMSVYRIHPHGASMGIFREGGNLARLKYLYHEFDGETGHRYGALIRKAVADVDSRHRNYALRRKWGVFHFLFHPSLAIRKIREYNGVIARYRTSRSQWMK
jgi:glycosyltransferase involved in cell wall biosynthesis